MTVTATNTHVDHELWFRAWSPVAPKKEEWGLKVVIPERTILQAYSETLVWDYVDQAIQACDRYANEHGIANYKLTIEHMSVTWNLDEAKYDGPRVVAEGWRRQTWSYT